MPRVDEPNVGVDHTLSDVEQAVHDALERQAERKAEHIEVSVNGDEVTLRERVHWVGLTRGGTGAAWSAPNVATVINHLVGTL